MMRRPFRKPSERQRKEGINAAMDFYNLPQFKTELAPKRERIRRRLGEANRTIHLVRPRTLVITEQPDHRRSLVEAHSRAHRLSRNPSRAR